MTQKNEACINDLLNMSDPSDTNNCQSEVSQCYTGCNILVTGGSGFLGILLIERLLRCCPGIRKLYMFIKEKKGKSAKERFKEHFDNVVYDKLKKEQPDFISKVVMIEADMGEADFGISPENRKRLLDTNIIFHLAAAVLFNRTIQFMVNVNVRGTKEILLFAREMPGLKAFVYVSTAYSYCMHKAIDEKYYTPPLETDKILTLLNVLDDKTLEKITPILIGEWPNTYVYTKAIAEDTVRQYSVGLPACIVRPSIVIATAKDPIAGWINNVYGATGILVGAAMGFLRCLHCVSENKADIIPADYVIANIIVAAWDTAKRKNTLLSIDNTDPNISETKRVPIYNYVSSTQNPVTWKTFMYLIEKHGLNIPPLNAIWYYMLLLIRYRFVYEICTIFLHTIPGAIFDILAVLTGRRPILLKSYKKLHTFNGVISYFATREWQFRNDSVVKLWNCLNPIDREIFNFNIQDLSWDEYIKNMIFGLRMYMVKESIDNLEEAHVRYKKLKVAHYTLLTTGSILLLWFFVNLIYFTISFFL
ncbi:fatty acyl-CoA reductase wat [Harpegnathos saltator]|uniref:fatty acyl-CoA reductase wat n=1 Tax=Harpegnathos saltator TaxID=610380 RepID=UPI00058FC9F5|nr:fatty acyl-CoA reductase wat [Harpegnathos saltator]XP_011146931.1 fatty acyl-CoA reductase wat [Harpegnathos saltator]